MADLWAIVTISVRATGCGGVRGGREAPKARGPMFLGVSVQTLCQWRHRGEGPPCVRLGKHLRFDPDRVRAWVADQVA